MRLLLPWLFFYHKNQSLCPGFLLPLILCASRYAWHYSPSSPTKTGEILATIRTISSLSHLRCSRFRCRNMTYEGVQSLSHSQTSLLQLLDNRCRGTTGRNSILYDPNQTASPRVPLAMGDRFPPFASKPCV